MILNAINSILGIVFPLITFPYVSRILGVEQMGQYSFAASIVNYLILFSALGISTYAIREGAKIRDDKEKLTHFASEMFSINCISTLISCLVYSALLLFVPKLHSYLILLVILGTQVLFKTIGVEYIYSIEEDFLFKTIRNILVNVLSLVLLFAFVRTENDLYVYAIVAVVASCGAELFNCFYSRKYCKILPTFRINWKKHLKPILIIFAMSLTVTIYVSSDTTILGILRDDYTVGIYSVSVKIYTVVKTVISSILIVSIPRLSSLRKEESQHNEFVGTASDIYRTLLTFTIPALVGIILLRKEIILILSDDSYIQATSSLILLSIALLFCMGAYFWGQAILVVNGKENIVFYITIASASLNIILNFILIPFWGEVAAALTTILSEALSYILCMIFGRKIIKPERIIGTILKAIIGSAFIVGVYFLLKLLITNRIVFTILVVAISVIIYLVVELALKNDAIISIIASIKRKFSFKKRKET